MKVREAIAQLQQIDPEIELFVYDGEFDVWSKIENIGVTKLFRLAEQSTLYVEPESSGRHPNQLAEQVDGVCVL